VSNALERGAVGLCPLEQTVPDFEAEHLGQDRLALAGLSLGEGGAVALRRKADARKVAREPDRLLDRSCVAAAVSQVSGDQPSLDDFHPLSSSLDARLVRPVIVDLEIDLHRAAALLGAAEAIEARRRARSSSSTSSVDLSGASSFSWSPKWRSPNSASSIALTIEDLPAPFSPSTAMQPAGRSSSSSRNERC
jgi:hypothetical protein